MLRNPVTGVSTKPVYDADGNIVKMVETQSGEDAEHAVKLARHHEENTPNLVGNTQTHHRHVAEIPAIVVNDLMRRGIWGDTKALLRWIETEGQIFKSAAGSLQ